MRSLRNLALATAIAAAGPAAGVRAASMDDAPVAPSTEASKASSDASKAPQAEASKEAPKTPVEPAKTPSAEAPKELSGPPAEPSKAEAASGAGAGDSKKPESPHTAAVRPDPPAPPRKYLEAGAKLFNASRFDLAARYLEAAHIYRDRLSANERIVLDVYREKLNAYLHENRAEDHAPAARGAEPAAAKQTDPGVVTASTTVSSPKRGIDPVKALTRRPDPTEDEILKALTTSPTAERGPASTAPPNPQATSSPPGTAAWRDTTDAKQKARWLLQLAREQIIKNNFEVAEQAIAEARSMEIKWTVFDETPERLTEALEKARAKSGTKPGSTAPGRVVDRKVAKARLKEARAAIELNDLDRADAIVREVRSWGVSYGLFDDTPERIASAIFAARRREAIRQAELTVKSYYQRSENGSTEFPRAPLPAGGDVRPADGTNPAPE